MSALAMTVLPYVFCVMAAYLAGSVNFAWLIARAKGFDIREKGSCNAGTTNAGRTMGMGIGALVLACDVCKAALVVWLAGCLFGDVPCIQTATAAACVAGHLYPFYLDFRGGKGIAVLLGSALALDWRLFLILLAGIAVITFLSDYMFIGTLTAAAGYWVWFLLSGRSIWDLALMLVVVALIFWKHRNNFARFSAGKELGIRASFFKKKYRVTQN